MGTEDKRLKATGSLACCKNRVAHTRHVRQRAQQITTGVRCGVTGLTRASPRGQPGAPEGLGWTNPGLQKISEDHLGGSVENKPREAEEKAVADSWACRGRGSQK